ncbi:TetR/AcrR family transcriptional regulator [Paenibacillus sp. R14(2021)]|uniref:TetR/AcrR family transcriptional regulator n=1 Tax=Paenibacillus sp. R14(2021) TaxID=2859228 RepID=UPI001C61156C|nr:TetR/AcrR family transcriptional regulator [Paenibacillus sp. R14(2021)]
MTSRRKQLTEDMKAAIRQAAAELFAERGYPSVTMREIAKQAGCSHTAIYLYFKNKEELLQQIAIPSLLELENGFLAEMENPALSPMDKLLAVCRRYVVFCLSNGSLHTVLFMSGSVRVDDPAPALEINVIRNRLFAHMKAALEQAMPGAATKDAETAINEARVLFYYIQGYVSTYTSHEEPTALLLERILPIFDFGIVTLLRGIKSH